MKKYIIDRLEEYLAVCQDEEQKQVQIPRNQLPKSLKEGDVLSENEGIFSVDLEETQARRERIRKKMMDLFQS